MSSSNIEWTDQTWNPIVGCTPVSPGCLNCYAATMARRLEAMGKEDYAPRGLATARGKVVRIAEVKGGRAVFTGDVRTLGHRLLEPLSWKTPRRVFVNSMSDLFHEDVPFEFIDKVFAVMNATEWQLPLPADVMKAKRWHTYQVLTKRPKRMAEYMLSRAEKFKCGQHPLFKVREIFAGHGPDIMNASACLAWPPQNVLLGTSVERPEEFAQRSPYLKMCPAAVRFLSCEPLIAPLDLHAPGSIYNLHDIHWVIVGGESGANARACDVAWIRSIVRQCREAGVPVFVKQLGAKLLVRNDSHSEWPRDGDGLLYPMDQKQGWSHQGELHEVRLEDRKGGDPSEWPEDLRVREWPGVKAAE